MGFWQKIGAAIDAFSADGKEKPQQGETPEERQKRLKKEENRKKYENEFMMKKSLEKIEDQIDELQEKAAEKYEKVKEFLRRGDRLNANLQSQACDQINTLIGGLQRRAVAFEMKIAAAQAGGASLEVMQYLSNYCQMTGNTMDPAELASAFQEIDMSSATIDELDNMLAKSWEKDAKKGQKKAADGNIESDTLKLAENEVLGEIAAKGNSSIVTETVSEAGNSVANSTGAQADKGLKELEDLMNGLK